MTFRGLKEFVNRILGREEEEDYSCSTCEGTGQVEKLAYECNDSTGYNTVVEGTGKFVDCPDCDGSGVWHPK